MTATFLWYAIITSACAGAAALAVEPLLRQVGKPVRWAWAGALVLSVALPALVPLRAAFAPATAAAPDDVASMLAGLPSSVVAVAPTVSPAAGSALLVGWLVASVALTLVIVGVHMRYRRLRTQWTPTRIAGEPVLVAPDTGPAVMGFVRPDIVLPRWILGRGDAEQQIVVAHEREHLRAGDPSLLGVASLAAVLMPWNPAVWWMLNRLRLAVEFDCDARVLRAGASSQSYGNLLIDVAALAAGHRVPSLALLHSTTHLKRRLIAMHPASIRFPRVRLAALSAAGALAILAACEAAVPTDATVASLDASAARRAAETMGGRADSVVYIVDGKPLTAAEAGSVKAEEIARVNVLKGTKLAGVRADTIAIFTKAGEEERALTFKARSGEGQPVAGMSLLGPQDVVVRARAEAATVDGAKMKHELGNFTGLIYLDDALVPASEMRLLDPDRIASVEVIKGAAAERIYGEKGRAGVIKITTKK